MNKQETKEEKKKEIMEKCFECYCEHGLNDTGIKALGTACGMTSANLYVYFNNIDELIVESTEYCMTKVVDEFLSLSPQKSSDFKHFFEKVPYWVADKHGKKIRLMYQVFSSPKYLEQGKIFFDGLTQRYAEYLKQFENKTKTPCNVITQIFFTYVRAVSHYAIFEDEAYLKSQIELLWNVCVMMNAKYSQ